MSGHRFSSFFKQRIYFWDAQHTAGIPMRGFLSHDAFWMQPMRHRNKCSPSHIWSTVLTLLTTITFHLSAMCTQAESEHSPAFHQNVVQAIHCKLILLRVRELHEDDRADHIYLSVVSHLSQVMRHLSVRSKGLRTEEMRARSKALQSIGCEASTLLAHSSAAGFTTINAILRKLQRYALLTLMYLILLRQSRPQSERTILLNRIGAFVATRPCAPHPLFVRVARHERAHLIATFDTIAGALFWHRRPKYTPRPPRAVRNAFLARTFPPYCPHHARLDEEVRDDVQGKESMPCPICYEPFSQQALAARFTCCNHEFHASCLHKWLLDQSDTCPMCRVELHPLSCILDNKLSCC